MLLNFAIGLGSAGVSIAPLNPLHKTGTPSILAHFDSFTVVIQDGRRCSMFGGKATPLLALAHLGFLCNVLCIIHAPYFISPCDLCILIAAPGSSMSSTRTW